MVRRVVLNISKVKNFLQVRHQAKLGQFVIFSKNKINENKFIPVNEPLLQGNEKNIC